MSLTVREASGPDDGRCQGFPADDQRTFPDRRPTGWQSYLPCGDGALSPEIRRALAWRVAVNRLLLMVGSYFVGAHVLNFFRVSLPVVQVGGGLIVASMGWGMLLEHTDTHEAARKSLPCEDALHGAFYPLTLPLTVGPGTISVAITLGANSTHRYGFHLTVILAALIAMVAIAVSVLLCYGLANQLARVLGKTAMTVIVRLSSFLLVCIGVQIMWNGLSGLL